jgi:hypothetical protein
VVVAAANVGLKALAITDHDTLSAVAVARPEAERLGVELIAGVELTAEYEGREVHILGHFVRDDDPSLVAATSSLRRARAERIRALVDRLEGLGLSVDLEALGRAFPRATLGRKHLADWLTRTGQVSSPRDAFARYLGDGGPAEVPKPRLAWTRGDRPDPGRGGRGRAGAPAHITSARRPSASWPTPASAPSRSPAPPSIPDAAVAGARGRPRWAWSRSPAPTSTPTTAPAAGSAPSPPRARTWNASAPRAARTIELS